MPRILIILMLIFVPAAASASQDWFLLRLGEEEVHREKVDGTPLHFSYRQKLGESEMRMAGDVLPEGVIRLRVRTSMRWRHGAFDTAAHGP